MTLSQTIKDLLASATGHLEIIGVWFGAITMLLVFWTWWEVVFGNKRKLRKLYQVAMRQTGDLPVILIANFLQHDRDMKSDVMRFINEHQHLKNIRQQHIFELSSDRPSIRPDDMLAVTREIRDVTMRISHTGTDCIHLFYGGPHIVASILGKEFANSHRVMLYQQDLQTKKYISYGPLAHHNI